MSDMVSQLFRAYSHFAGTSGRSLWLCLIVTLAFAIVAFLARAVSFSGGVAGVVVCFLLCAGAGLPALAPLLAVFAMAWLGTKVGYQKKVKIGTAEKIEGRNALQVLANLSVAAICATPYSVTGKAAFLVAMAASLSEAAADTVSSEVGQLSREKARLISTWEAVPAGTDGAITALGTVSGIAAAMVVSVVCALTGIISWKRFAIPILAALCGTITDSFLGALFERRKLLNNDTVNFLGTLVAALIAISA